MPRHRRGWAMGARGEGGGGVGHSPLTISMLEPALLFLLKGRPRHGYTLLSDLGALGMNTIHPSVVYRTLRDMESLGWIQSDWDVEETQGPPRRTYRMTERGVAALKNWQEELGKTSELIAQLMKSVEGNERS